MVTHTAPTKEQVEQFVSNMRESLLQAIAANEPVLLTLKNDHEPVENEFGIVSDARFMGCKFTIRIGRPALPTGLRRR